jgi:hypothetical protein
MCDMPDTTLFFLSTTQGGMGGGPAVATELRHSSATCVQRKHMLTSHMEEGNKKRRHIYKTDGQKKRKRKISTSVCTQQTNKNNKSKWLASRPTRMM